LAEEAAGFGLERPVVDGLRIFNFALGPRADRVRGSDGDGDEVKRLLFLGVEKFGGFGADLWL
jgi:hypothetical protein